MKKISAKSIFVLFVIVISVNFVNFAYAGQVYYPYPIVFVHGINSSDEMWRGMRNELRQYFWTTGVEGGYKYPDQVNEINYFISCDYQDQNNSHIPDIVTRLSFLIDKALSYYPPETSVNDRKVIIVCHSMGGLVTRSLLTLLPSYQNKIFRVVFIDTPHLGSPYASILWLLNQVRDGNAQIIPSVKSITYNSYTAFSPLLFANKEAIERATVCTKIFNTQIHIALLLTPLDFTGPKPRGDAIKDLRTPAFTHYEATYSGLLSDFTVTLYDDYAAGDTFLGQNNLTVPTDYKVITGSTPPGYQVTLWSVNKLLKFSSAFRFSTLAGESQSLDNAIFNGDGIVTMSSQETVGGTARADYQVSGFHVGVVDNAVKETLQAIENQPVIESAYAIPVDWNDTYATKTAAGVYNSDKSLYYVIFKLKDYLLADIAVEQLNLITDTGTTNLLDLVSQYKVDDVYMPYLQFNKDFLKERTYDGNGIAEVTYKDINGVDQYLHLMPGEFYIQAKIPLNAQSIYIKIKNPADQYDSDPQHTKFTVARIFTLTRPSINTLTWSPKLIPGYAYLSHMPYTTPYVMDIAPYDWAYKYDYSTNPATIIGKNRSIAPKDSTGLTLSFGIAGSPYQDIIFNIWLRDWHGTQVWRKFTTAQTSSSASGTYSFNDFVTWHGEADQKMGGQKVPHIEHILADGSTDQNHGGNITAYELDITVQPIESPDQQKDDVISLLGSSRDIDSQLYNSSDQEYKDTHNNMVGADPTFVQPSRREDISW